MISYIGKDIYIGFLLLITGNSVVSVRRSFVFPPGDWVRLHCFTVDYSSKMC